MLPGKLEDVNLKNSRQEGLICHKSDAGHLSVTKGVALYYCLMLEISEI